MPQYKFSYGGRWLRLQHLDYHSQLSGSLGSIGFWSFGFLVGDDASDEWTIRFRGLKQDSFDQKSLDGAKRLLKSFDWRSSGFSAVFAPVPSGHPFIQATHPLFDLANHLANCCGCQYYHQSIERVHLPSLHRSKKTRAERNRIARGMFRDISIPKLPPASRVVIIDDVVTCGSQLAETARLILNRNPSARILAIAMAKYERSEYIHLCSEGHKTNSSISPSNQEAWDGP